MLNLDKAGTAAAVAPKFAALGDVTRLRLLARLSDGQPCSISQLASGLELTRQGVTKHLQVMAEAGILTSNRAGRENRFAIDPEAMHSMQIYLETVSKQWDVVLARLQDFVER